MPENSASTYRCYSQSDQFKKFNEFLLSKNKLSPQVIKEQAKTRNINKSNFNDNGYLISTEETFLHSFMRKAVEHNITKENIECLKELGGDFNSLDLHNQNPLGCYLSREDVDLDIFKFLLSKKIGADMFITEGTEYNKFNHLHTYLLSKKNEISIEILRYFKKDLGADFNCATRGNFKVSHLLCIHNSKKITKEILSYLKDEAVVDFNALDRSNKNIAHYYLNSCEEPNEEIVKTLGEFGVDFAQKDSQDRTVAHFYLQNTAKVNEGILLLLKQKSGGINEVNKNHATPMDIALHRHNIMREIKNEDIELLEKLGFHKKADLESADNENENTDDSETSVREEPIDSKNYSFFEYIKNGFSSFFGIFFSNSTNDNSENVELNDIENNLPGSKSLPQKFFDIFSACTSFIFPSWWSENPAETDISGANSNYGDGDN